MSAPMVLESQTQSAPALPSVAEQEPIRVLHIVPELSSGGMERAMLRLIRRSLLQDRCTPGGSGIEHAICVLREVQEDLRSQCPLEVPTYVLGASGSMLSRYRTWRRLRRIVQQFRADVVHARSTGTWFDATAAVAGLLHVRLLLSFHGLTSTDAPSRARQALNRWTVQRSDGLLAVCHQAANTLRTRLTVPTDKLHVILNGVDTHLFCPSESEGEVAALRRRLRIDLNADVAICIANLVPIKGLELLLRAWRRVCMADPLARLLLVGEGPMRGELDQLVRAARCGAFVQFLGPREDVPLLLRASDLFALPSRYEACSNATLEAMASGLPVVAFDVGGMCELVQPHHTGWLIPAFDEDSLSRNILTALLDRSLRQRLGHAARDVAVRKFGIDTWVARYYALYRRLAGRPAAKQTMEDEPCAE